MAELSADQIRDVISSLCDMWDADVHTDVEGRPEMQEGQLVAIHTTAHHAVQMARALLKVDEPGAGIAPVLVARSVLESAISAAWLLLTPTAAHKLIKEGSRQRKVALDELIQQGHDVEDSPGYVQSKETLNFLEEQGIGGGAQLREQSRSFQGGDQLYSIYRALSGRSHPGLGVMDFYVVEDSASETGVAFNPRAVDDTREATLGVAATALILALQADELARKKPHRTTQLKKAAKRIGMRLDITRPDGTTLPPR